MLFNSYEFLFLFLPLTFMLYFTFNRYKLVTASKVWLVFASLLFYSWWNINYLPVILISILANYFISGRISSGNSKTEKKAWLLVGLSGNILTLMYFKYGDFFISSVNSLSGAQIGLLSAALPLGISFFTITQITYLVDVYEGLINRVNCLNYFLFVTFFPHLLMGPILHHKQMMPQFDNLRTKVILHKNVSQGIFLFFVGLFKKIIIADYFSVWANTGFDVLPKLSLFEAWATSLSYTLQLYFDFSGYTDMALGVALLFNIRLPINFNTPYRATSVIDFWQRWHISLTNFITTYLYTPILKSFARVTFNNAMIAIFLSMLLAGLWHGINIGFVLFYVMHAFALVINHVWKKYKIKINSFVAWVLTFLFVNVSLTVFRSHDLATAIKLLKGMLGLDWGIWPMSVQKVLFSFGSIFQFANLFVAIELWIKIMVCLIVAVYFNSDRMAAKFRPTVWGTLVILLVALYSILNISSKSPFLYFNF